MYVGSNGGLVEPRGERIEEYECSELLGKGAFASVYRARCRITGRYFAIKMIDKHLMKINRMTDRVKQEADIHRRLSHPAVLQLYRFFEDQNYIYLVLELAKHGDIQNYLSANNIQLNESETAVIMQQIVDGLKYLHSNNILHRDMKLPNLLVTAGMRVKIADFGLATQLSRPDEKHMTMCGTPNYISPEVAMRTAHGQPADVWGLGIMMYTLLVGRPPFDTDGVASTLKKVVSSELMIPIHMSAEARDLLDQLLQKDPNARCRLDDVLRHPFMRKHLPPPPEQLAAIAHDSGVMTMSTNPSSISASGLCRTRSEPYPQSRYQLQQEPIVEEMAEQYDLLPPRHIESGYAGDHYGSSANLNGYAQGLQRFGSESALSKPHSERFGVPRQGSMYAEPQHMDVEPVFQPNIPTHFATPQSVPQPPSLRIEVDQLNAERLLPTRYKTKKAILSIDGHGQVIVELLRFKSKLKQDRVIDVCRISRDGSRIEIYQPDPGRGLEVHETPPPFVAQQVFTFAQLPAKHWKKYTYAARFVQLVRAKTPKITYYSRRAKCQLMETLEDFEMFFYESDEKFTKSAAEGIRYYDPRGICVPDAESHAGRPGLGPTLALWDHFQHCHNHCVALEKTLRMMQTDGEVFPNTAGRRPVTMPQVVGSRAMAEQCTNILTPRTPNMQSFAMSISSSTTSSRMPTPLTQSKSTPFCASSGRVLVPGIGIATKSAQGVLEVQYNDDTQLSVLPKEQGGGFIFRKSVSDGGIPMRYTINDELPELVRVRLEQIPLVLKHMAAQDGFSSGGCTAGDAVGANAGGQMTATSTPLTTRKPNVMRFCR